MRRSACTALVLLSACGSERVEIPAPASAKSAILLVDGAPVSVWANDLSAPASGLAEKLPGGSSIALLAYLDPLAAHHMKPGRVLPADPGDPKRSLPVPDVSYRLDPGGHTWTEVDPAQIALYRSFRFRGDLASDCLLGQGCFPSSTEAECFSPCPPPAAPAPPDFEDLPTPPAMVCRQGWVQSTFVPAADNTRRFPMCAPFSGDAPHCTWGQAALPGSASCLIIGGDCPGGDGFPTQSAAGRSIYLASGAQGGDGSRAAPFGSLGAALAAARAGDSVLIRSGRYDGDAVLPAGVTLRGACARSTTIAGSIEVLGTSTVAAVTLTPNAAGDILHADMNARLSMEGILFSRTAAARARIDASASVSVAHSAAGGDALIFDVGKGASLVFAAAAFASGTLELGGDPSARVAFADASIKASVVARSLTVEAKGVLFSGASPMIMVDGAALSIDQSSFEAEPSAKVRLIDAKDARIFAARTRFFTGGDVLYAVSTTASISDALVRTTTASGDAIAVDQSALFLGRMVFDIPNGAGVVATESMRTTATALMEVRSTAIFGGSEFAIEAKGGVELRVRDVFVEGHGGQSIGAIEGVGDGSVDCDIQDVRIVQGYGGIRVSDARRARIARVFMRDLQRAGLEVNEGFGAKPAVEANDVEIDAFGKERCSSGLSCGSAVAVEAGTVKLSRFALENGTIGAAVSQSTGVGLSQGLFRSLDIGIAAFASMTDLPPLIEGTRFEEVRAACGPCGK